MQFKTYKIFLKLVSYFIIASLVFQGYNINHEIVQGSQELTEANPISFTLKIVTDENTPNKIKYEIKVNDVYNVGDIAYKTIFMTYPNSLKLVADELPDGYILNSTQNTGAATVVIDNVNNGGLTPTDVKSTLEKYYFILNEEGTFPREGSVVGISANKNKISFHEDERGYLHYYQFFPEVTTWLQAYNLAKSKEFIDPFTNTTLKGYLATITSQEEQKMIYRSIAKEPGWLGGTRLVNKGTNTKLQDPISVDETDIPGTDYPTLRSYDFSYSITTDRQWYWACGPEAFTKPSVGSVPYDYVPTNDPSATPLVFWNRVNYYSSEYANPIPGVYQCFRNPRSYSMMTGEPVPVTVGGEPNGIGSTKKEYALQFAYKTSVNDPYQDTWNDLANLPSAGTINGYYVEYGGYIGDPNTKTMGQSLTDTAVSVPQPVTVLHRSNIQLNGVYNTIAGIGTDMDTTIFVAENDKFSVSPLSILTTSGYIFKEVVFLDTPQNESGATIDQDNKVTGKISTKKQTIVFLYEDKTGLSITLNAEEEGKKYYLPNFPATEAQIDTVGNITPNEDVQYIMLPTTDTSTITTKTEFEAKAATIADEFKGKMHWDDIRNLYNMYDINNPKLKGVLENCKLWVMATGTNSNDHSEVVAFDSHIFTNIYTPINVYHKGQTTSGTALYANTRVALNGDLQAKYGIPKDLNGDIIQNPPLGYDTINVIHQVLDPLWTLDSTDQQDIYNLNLNSLNYANYEFIFKYNKIINNWFSATIEFVDEWEVPIPGTTPETVDYFIPNDNGGKSYMSAKDLYTPPNIAGYDPIGFIANNQPIKYTSFPIKYGDIVLTTNHETIKIVYRSVEKKVIEKYYLFETNENGTEIFKGEIDGFSPSTTSVITNSSFHLTPPNLYGYAYKGYSNNNGLTYSDGAPISPITIVTDTTIIYKYKADATLTGIADEDTKRIVVSGVGINAKGQIEKILYTDEFNKRIGEGFQPIAQGLNNGNGKIILAGDGVSQWILSTDDNEYLNSIAPFQVSGNKAIKFRYYKDTSGNGIPDYLEANITIKYYNEITEQPLLNDLEITEHSPDESFIRIAPEINNYVAVGVFIQSSIHSSISHSVGIVKGQIRLLGTDNWVMKFLYQPDFNNNGIPDNVESRITVITIYKLTNGQEETETKEYIGYHGENLKLSASDLNKDATRFEYIDGMISSNTTYMFNRDNPQTITLNFKERTSPTPTPDNNDNNDNNDSEESDSASYSTPTPSAAPKATATTNATEKPTEKPTEKSKIDDNNTDDNNYSWSTFEKPEIIFLDGELLPLGRLIFNGPYIYGYPDKTIGPDRNLTRAEAAQIIYNLYGRPDELVKMEGNLPYKDVNSNTWYAKAVAFLTQNNFITGYPDGLFYPNKAITRAELVTLLTKYDSIYVNSANENIFEDVVNHWAKPQINAAYKNNIISGYPDLTFRPNQLATRSEAVSIINTMLRRPDKWLNENEFTDLDEIKWAYKKLMNAANGYAED